MISNLLPTEATHSSLEFFEKPPLLVTFANAFTQKNGPSYSPDGPMLEIEVLGDRNNFIDLQRSRLEILARIVQNYGNVLRTHATKATHRETPYLVKNLLSSSRGYYYKDNPSSIEAADGRAEDAAERKRIVAASRKFRLFGKIACDFLSCDKHVISGVTIRLSLIRSPNDFVFMSEPIQSANSVLCGLYCIYVAHVILIPKIPIGFKVKDHDMMRFAKHMML